MFGALYINITLYVYLCPLVEKMNCECAMARRYLSDLSRKPQCCKNGNFVGKQCVAGFCFCVNEFGQQISTEKDQIEELECDNFCCDDKVDG